jgi:hypothetical protein
MADNVVLNSGSGGATLATDDVAGVHYQIVKISTGALDAAGSPVSTANPMPVNDAGGSLTVDGTVTANAGTDLNTSALALESGGNLATIAGAIKTEDAAHSSGHVGIMPLAVRNDAATALAGTHGDYIPLSTDSSGALRVREFGPGTIDTFGHLITGSVHNQIDIQWFNSDGSVGDLVTETNANGGTATASNGMATFAATTTASSQAKGVTTETTSYTGGTEVYALFTAAFTGTGAGTSYHRIGLYDANNGFFIGREANTFGFSVRKGGSDSQTAIASFNVDTLTGAAGSAFTRAGVAEAIDLTKLNVWRIRFGWIGSAPIHLDVLSPDGRWVECHIIRQPNNAALPSINTANLPITCDVNSGNSGNALSILTNCWVAGTTGELGKLSETLKTSDYATLVRSVITGYSTAGGGAFVNVKVNPSGAVTVDASGATVPVSVAAGATTIAKAEDAASADADVGVPAMAVRKATPANTSGTDGDYEMLQMSGGRLWTSATIDAQLPAGTNAIGKLAANTGVTIGAVEIASAQTLATVTTCSTVTTLTGSGVAHDSADSGNPHKIGAKAETSLSGITLVVDGDRTDLYAGVDGVLITRPHCNLEDIVTGNASNTDGSSTQCIAAQSAGIKTYLTSIVLTNTSSTNTFCEIKDGTTAKLTIPVPANGGAVFNPPVPLGGTAATAWNFDPGTAVTTMYCSMIGFKSKV